MAALTRAGRAALGQTGAGPTRASDLKKKPNSGSISWLRPPLQLPRPCQEQRTAETSLTTELHNITLPATYEPRWTSKRESTRPERRRRSRCGLPAARHLSRQPQKPTPSTGRHRRKGSPQGPGRVLCGPARTGTRIVWTGAPRWNAAMADRTATSADGGCCGTRVATWSTATLSAGVVSLVMSICGLVFAIGVPLYWQPRGKLVRGPRPCCLPLRRQCLIQR